MEQWMMLRLAFLIHISTYTSHPWATVQQLGAKHKVANQGDGMNVSPLICEFNIFPKLQVDTMQYILKIYNPKSAIWNQSSPKSKIQNPKISISLNHNQLPKSNYKVYVVELSKRVFTENAKFRAANPQFNGVLDCLYVGMTSKDPTERFKQHKTKYISKRGDNISSWLVWKYGTYLRPSLFDHINSKPMSRKEALMAEKKLALDLRRQGYAVWFN